MVVGLISPHEERQLFSRLISYYKKLYPREKFRTEEKIFPSKTIGGIYYTYPGEEAEATAQEKVREIREAINFGYDSPIIVLRKRKKLILLDGHRRVKVAWEKKIRWKALIISTDARKEFGIEKMVMGKVSDLW